MIGSGGQGSVFSCTIESKEYAGKKIGIKGEEIKKELIKQINLMEKMKHKNLVSVKKKIIRFKVFYSSNFALWLETTKQKWLQYLKQS